MAAGCLCCAPCFITHVSMLLLVLGLHDMEALDCPSVISKKVGDSVEFPTCYPSEGVTFAEWRYKSGDVFQRERFKGRVSQNSNNFSLTLRDLTVQDSGIFMFVSTVGNTQRKTISITLQVHEVIMEKPSLAVNSTWLPSNSSCVVVLECRSAPHHQLTFRLTVGNQSHAGPRVQFTLAPQQGVIPVTCTVSNLVSEESDSISVSCSNTTQEAAGELIFVYVAAGASLLLVVVVTVAVGVCCCSKRAAASSRDLNNLYADITDPDVSSDTLKNVSSIYETINDRENLETAGTVYDMIQLRRMQKAPSSLSPAQHDDA
ncbi:T-lymphocyte surface antigen Ly-9 [Genypterus blacodes]|uniref:T-lymphocyte surface antigen Ly-9 n=1 Tax=Genypterus blacodes TaxID=154954 RepID=UPI003F7757B8